MAPDLRFTFNVESCRISVGLTAKPALCIIAKAVKQHCTLALEGGVSPVLQWTHEVYPYQLMGPRHLSLSALQIPSLKSFPEQLNIH